MRVLVVGAGGVGGYFGGRLLEAGRDVTFLVRPRRRAQLAADGLVIRSPFGDATLSTPTVEAGEIAAPWDLILLSCKAYDLSAAMDSFAPAVGPETAILPLLNGMSHLDALDDRFGADRVLGGLCSLAVTLDADGTIRHMNRMHELAFGERAGGESPRVKAIAELFGLASISWRLSPDIVQEMWEKWIFLSSLATGTCLFRGSVGDMVLAGGADTILALLAEAQSVAEAAGRGGRQAALDKARGLLVDAGSSLTASMLRDVERGGAVEADHVIGDLLRRGQAAGLAVPLLKLAYLHMKTYEIRRQRNGLPRQD